MRHILLNVNQIRELKITNGDILVSYDVLLLSVTNVPLETAIHLLPDKVFCYNCFSKSHDLNLSKQDFANLINAATKHQLYLFNGSSYEQFNVVTMGSPVGPLLANVFMRSIVESLEWDVKIPTYYRRYINDKNK